MSTFLIKKQEEEIIHNHFDFAKVYSFGVSLFEGEMIICEYEDHVKIFFGEFYMGSISKNGLTIAIVK